MNPSFMEFLKLIISLFFLGSILGCHHIKFCNVFLSLNMKESGDFLLFRSTRLGPRSTLLGPRSTGLGRKVYCVGS